MHLLDSSILIAFFRENELQHAHCRQLLASFQNFAVSEYVLLEVATVLKLKEGMAVSKKAVDLLYRNSDVTLVKLNDGELEATVEFFSKEPSRISFVDASLLILSKRRKLQLLTLDKQLKKLDSR